VDLVAVGRRPDFRVQKTEPALNQAVVQVGQDHVVTAGGGIGSEVISVCG